jgi:low temperature requirement protein LtrA
MSHLRVTIFALALAAVFMALALSEACADLGLLFPCAYWAGRLALAPSLLRRSARGAAGRLNPHTISIFVTGPLLITGGLAVGMRDAWLIRAITWGGPWQARCMAGRPSTWPHSASPGGPCSGWSRRRAARPRRSRSSGA